MEKSMKPSKHGMKKKQQQLQTIYSKCLITRKIMLPITSIGKNLYQTIDANIKHMFESKCVIEGYIKGNSSKVITYSSGIIERGNIISFEVVFECEVCFPIEGMLIKCKVKNITKAGITAYSDTEFPSPILVFIAKDHHTTSSHFANIKEDETIRVKVIGQRFELNDKYISIIGELKEDREDREEFKKSSITFL